jgi:hypothetical protein
MDLLPWIVMTVAVMIIMTLSGLADLLLLESIQNRNERFQIHTCYYAGYNFNRISLGLYDASVTVLDTMGHTWLRFETLTSDPTYQEQIFKLKYPLNVNFPCYVEPVTKELAFALDNPQIYAILTIASFIVACVSGIFALILIICLKCGRSSYHGVENDASTSSCSISSNSTSNTGPYEVQKDGSEDVY